MRVVAVTPFSPCSESATVTVSDGRYTCEAFCHPCDYEVGVQISEPLQIFHSTMLVLANQPVARLEHVGPQYHHRGVARVVDKDRGLLEVGNLRLEGSTPLPGGIETGSFVEFECARIDLM